VWKKFVGLVGVFATRKFKKKKKKKKDSVPDRDSVERSRLFGTV
jgi:hypothetical protein